MSTAKERRKLLQTIASATARLADLQVDSDNAGTRGGSARFTAEATDKRTSSSRTSPTLQEGDRVRVRIKGVYFNRTGRLISRHGTLFWNVLLDKLPNETMALTIQKKDASLKAL